MKNLLKFLGLAALTAAVVVPADYLTANEQDSSTLTMRGDVVEVHDEVFQEFGSRGRYITKKEGLAGNVAALIQKGMNMGNSDVAYIVDPTSYSYMTEGSIFFKPKLVENKVTPDSTYLAIISDIVKEGVEAGTQVQFKPTQGLSLTEMIVKGRPKVLTITSQDVDKSYTNVLVNPSNFSKIN